MLTIPFNPLFVVGKSHSILQCWSFPLNCFFTFTESMSSDRILITFLNQHFRNTSSGHYLLESRTCQRISYGRIQVCLRFSCDAFLTSGQEFQWNTIPLLGGCNLESLPGKRSPPVKCFEPHKRIQANDQKRSRARQRCITNQGMLHEFMYSDCLMIRWGGINWLPNSVIQTFFWSSLFPCDNMSVGLMKYPQNLPGNSQRYVQYVSQSHSLHSVYEDRWQPLIGKFRYESGSTSFPPKTAPPPVYRPPPPHSRSIQDDKSGRMSLLVPCIQFEEFVGAGGGLKKMQKE